MGLQQTNKIVLTDQQGSMYLKLRCKDIAKSPASMSDTEYVVDTIACLQRVRGKSMYICMYYFGHGRDTVVT